MRSLFWLPLLFVLTSGCSLKNRTDFRGISVQLPPKELSVARLSRHEVSAKENSSFVTPSTIGDFQCFALNVVGNGIPFDSRFSCKNSLSKIGIVGGFIPLTQNVIEMMVPVGSNRTIQLIGVQSSIGCPNFGDFFSDSLLVDTPLFGEPYILAETTIDVFDDRAITLTALLDQNNLFMPECNGQENFESTPTPTPSPSPTCPLDQFWSGATCVDRCVGGTVWDNSLSVCIQSLECSSGSFISGVNFRHGDIVDGYQLLCSSYVSGVLSSIFDAGPSTGGSGGNLSNFQCGSNSLVSQVATSNDYGFYYGSTSAQQYTCKDLSNFELTSADLLNASTWYPGTSFEKVLTCPSGQFAYGVRVTPGVVYTGVLHGLLCRQPQ